MLWSKSRKPRRNKNKIKPEIRETREKQRAFLTANDLTAEVEVVTGERVTAEVGVVTGDRATMVLEEAMRVGET